MLRNDLGAKNVLSEDSNKFMEELGSLIEQKNPTILFDFDGGDLPCKILQKMPEFSKLCSMGNLKG